MVAHRLSCFSYIYIFFTAAAFLMKWWSSVKTCSQCSYHTDTHLNFYPIFSFLIKTHMSVFFFSLQHIFYTICIICIYTNWLANVYFSSWLLFSSYQTLITGWYKMIYLLCILTNLLLSISYLYSFPCLIKFFSISYLYFFSFFSFSFLFYLLILVYPFILFYILLDSNTLARYTYLVRE